MVDNIASLFNVRSHNPSFFSVKEAAPCKSELLDFCIPVNLHFPPPAMVQLVHEHLDEILRYYPDYAATHQQHIHQLTGLPAETIVPANGSTEIITRLCQQTRGPIVTSAPTFSRWTDLPEELSVPLFTILRERRKQFRLGPEEIVKRVRDVAARTLVISNPNNPTGAWLELDEIKSIVAQLRDLDAVIIDESFIDFSDLGSAASLVVDFPNLIVVKSLGKSFGWHGVRLGYGVATPERAKCLLDSLPFWNVNGLAAYVLKNAPQFRTEYLKSFAQVARDRSYMKSQLAEVEGLTVFPSKANFLYVELPSNISGRVLRDSLLARHGIMVRECSNKLGSSEQFLRLAVQTKSAVDRLISVLQGELY